MRGRSSELESTKNGNADKIKVKTKKVAELLLTLQNPTLITENNKTRAHADAELTFYPPDKNSREVRSFRFPFQAPIGPIEAEDLRWYLEQYYLWPTGIFKKRAKTIESNLPKWGQMLYNAISNAPIHSNISSVMKPWDSVSGETARRFTIYVDNRPFPGASDAQIVAMNQAATELMALPWELMHRDGSYLFEGAKPVQVRRRFPFNKSVDRIVSKAPIRILMISPRPEDKSAGYIDHRISALPLVDAVQPLGKLVDITFLDPPTFPAFQQALQNAQDKRKPFHVVHFDGHGVFSKELGLGSLCFEDPQDDGKWTLRRSELRSAEEMASVIRDYRIPLVFLEACQTAKAEEDPTASVAAKLLDQGVSAVVAMSHSVLVETAKRFVAAFYKELANGARIGQAMINGQNTLKNNRFRMMVFAAGKLELQDWFVPVLFQEAEDIQLVKALPSAPMKETQGTDYKTRLSELPKPPKHTFVGRSRELLMLERMLSKKDYAVIRGEGGEGKTTLAVEFARWMLRTGRTDHTMFVSMERITSIRAVVDAIGRQLLKRFSVAEHQDTQAAMRLILKELKQYRVLLILDNMESVLPVPNGKEPAADVSGLSEKELGELWKLCETMLKVGGMKIVFTSREGLPEPFDSGSSRVELRRMSKGDAVELVTRTMTEAGCAPVQDELGKTDPGVEGLVEAVQCHARSLVLLAPHIGKAGVAKTTEEIVALMAMLDQQYPNEREKSLFASVELSLRRVDKRFREKLNLLGLYWGGADDINVRHVLGLSEEDADELLVQLESVGLAEHVAYGFYRFHPALGPYLNIKRGLTEAEWAEGKIRWLESMRQLSGFLYEQVISQNARMGMTLTVLELPNLMKLLDAVQEAGDAEATADLAGRLEQLIVPLGRPQLLGRVSAIREAAAQQLTGWSHRRFEATRMQVERLLGGGELPRALHSAQELLEQCVAEGETAYKGAAYDTAMAFFLLGRVLNHCGLAAKALQLTQEAGRRFQVLAEQGNESAAQMASAAWTEQGDCLADLGRLDEAADAYEAGIKLSEAGGRVRQTAVGKGQLATVRKNQKRYSEAIEGYEEAITLFETLGEPASVATILHQMGMAYQDAGNAEGAEQAYRRSLAIEVQQNNPAGEADTLLQLGNLYGSVMGRLEEAVAFYRQAADISVRIGDNANEGMRRSNLAGQLIKLKRLEEARTEILRAIECKKPYGHASEPWKTYDILCDLELAEGHPEAAAAARQKAIELYLSYRRDGGENHSGGGRLCLAFLQAMKTNQTAELETGLAELRNDPETHPFMKVLCAKLQSILSGSRDAKLAEDPELWYADAAEILFILEKLNK